jgi:hypothetical protein
VLKCKTQLQIKASGVYSYQSALKCTQVTAIMNSSLTVRLAHIFTVGLTLKYLSRCVDGKAFRKHLRPVGAVTNGYATISTSRHRLKKYDFIGLNPSKVCVAWVASHVWDFTADMNATAYWWTFVSVVQTTECVNSPVKCLCGLPDKRIDTSVGVNSRACVRATLYQVRCNRWWPLPASVCTVPAPGY